MGHDYSLPEITVRLEGGFRRKRAERTEHVPVRLTPGGGAAAVDYHGSAHIHAYTAADGMMRIPAGVSSIDEGENVTVIVTGPPRSSGGR